MTVRYCQIKNVDTLGARLWMYNILINVLAVGTDFQ